MAELGIGLFVGFWLGGYFKLPPSAALVVAGLVALITYFLSCLIFPYRQCWWCGGDRRQYDGRENYRYKRTCWWCRGESDNRRIGARLMGRG